jgi:hypothetical protein
MSSGDDDDLLEWGGELGFLVSPILSVLGSLYIIVAVFWFKETILVPQLVFVSIADVFYSILWILRLSTVVTVNRRSCVYVFTISEYFAFCAWLWTAVIASEALFTVCRFSERSFELLNKYQHAIWGVALVSLAGIPTKNNNALDVNENNFCNYRTSSIWTDKIPIISALMFWASFIYCSICYAFIIKRSRQMAPHSVSTRLVWKSAAYLLVFIICWLPVNIWGFNRFVTPGKGDYVMFSIVAVLEPLQGLLNVLVYYVGNKPQKSEQEDEHPLNSAYHSLKAEKTEPKRQSRDLKNDKNDARHLRHVMFGDDTKLDDGNGDEWRVIQEAEILKRKKATESQLKHFLELQKQRRLRKQLMNSKLNAADYCCYYTNSAASTCLYWIYRLCSYCSFERFFLCDCRFPSFDNTFDFSAELLSAEIDLSDSSASGMMEEDSEKSSTSLI